MVDSTDIYEEGVESSGSCRTDNISSSTDINISTETSTVNAFIQINDNEEELFKNNNIILNKVNEKILAYSDNKDDVNISSSESINNNGYNTIKNALYRRIPSISNLHDTSFRNKIDLAADYQGSNIMFVSDQTFGAAINLLKTTVVDETKLKTWEKENEENGIQNGWLVKRHEPNASAVIQLGVSGTVSGIDVDLRGYKQCAPAKIFLMGHIRDSPGKWSKILPKTFVDQDSHNFFEIKNANVFSHIQVTMEPGGGISRLRVYGDVVPLSIPVDKVINLASNKLGAEIVQKPLNLIRGNIPNIILDRADSSDDGWISARNKNTRNIPQYTIIKLATKGVVERFVVDTKHFIGNAPQSIVIQGCSVSNQDKQNLDNINWVNLIDEEDQSQGILYPNMFHVISCIHMDPITHIRIQPIPDGGIQQIKVKGKVYLELTSARNENQERKTNIPGNKRKRKESEKITSRRSLRLAVIRK
ncbi:galactose-binding domain-like protein [Pilaira anomala]|nr:galactose-binding domain-like protein [Pilaira anomala]